MSRPDRPLAGRTALVTGASRGIGRGIAIGFGELGATVIATGSRPSPALDETALLVERAGGTCEARAVDAGDDDAVTALFAELQTRLRDSNQKLDFVVNSAYSAVDFIIQSRRLPTWRKSAKAPAEIVHDAPPGEVWDLVNRVGLRANFVSGSLAFRQFAKQGSGVLVNVSSYGGLMSLFDGAYGVGKAAVDRMSAEFAREAPEGVKCFTLYPGAVSTEKMTPVLENPRSKLAKWNAESPLFVGRVLARSLADDKLQAEMHGCIVIAAEMARRVGAKDEDGKQPLSARSLRFTVLNSFPSLVESPLRFLIPDFYVPLWILQLYVGVIKLW